MKYLVILFALFASCERYQSCIEINDKYEKTCEGNYYVVFTSNEKEYTTEVDETKYNSIKIGDTFCRNLVRLKD